MSDFLNAIKVDLLDSRRRPILAVLVVALVAALAYALLGGGSSASSPALSPLPVRPGFSGIPVSQAPANTDQAVAETTSGASKQRTGSSRDPFAPLPGTGVTTTSTATATSTASSSPAGAQSGSSTQGGGGTSSGTGTQKASTPRVLIRYHVTAQFGVVPPVAEGAPPQPAELKTYRQLALNQPLPSKDNAQLVFLGVVLRTGNEAVFALTGAAILHGAAVCLPSATQCRGIKLHLGQSETLDTFDANGNPVTYELKLVAIAKHEVSASTARARTATRAAKAARIALADGAARHPHTPHSLGLRFDPLMGGLDLAHPRKVLLARGAKAAARSR
ncbi:MAG: hypothetical protein E6G34_03820 [Actinobacteria bacterium]|nr:MAG: hypothetical protein E6G34_03820 [Actinomycetota bacterium]